MKGFKLNSGDVEITNKRIVMVEGAELTRQNVQQVLSTNKGEWVLNPDEGIDFKNILGRKAPTQKAENNALKKVYETKIAEIRADESELAKKLEKRLEGDD